MIESSEPHSRQESFEGMRQLIRDFADGKLTINRVQQAATPLVRSIESDPGTWVSRTHNNKDGTVHISIGEQAIPDATLRRWKWGTDTVEGQYAVKVSHEYAHIVQKAFDNDLLSWLDQIRGSFSQVGEQYIRLYAGLNQNGPVTGLAAGSLYHEQSSDTGNLDMQTYEDLAELIGARMLSKDYFAFRMRNTNVQVSEEDIASFAARIDALVEQFLFAMERRN